MVDEIVDVDVVGVDAVGDVEEEVVGVVVGANAAVDVVEAVVEAIVVIILYKLNNTIKMCKIEELNC